MMNEYEHHINGLKLVVFKTTIGHCTSTYSYMTAKRDFLFRYITPSLRNQLLLDDEALYSTTDQLTAEKITQDILKYVPSTATITDATACIGGSAHSFAQTFTKVYAIEIDPTRFTYLQNNVNVLSDANVVCVHGDALQECVRIKQDVIFIDPPWGGPEYKNRDRVSLFLSHIPLHEVCKTLSKHTKYIVIKVPTNFDDTAFYEATSASLQFVHKNTSLRKMNLIILKALP